MDKYEYRVKTEQMLEYAEKKEYKKAMEIADTIEWRRVKSTVMLNTVSEIYEHNGEYQRSRDVLFMAYDKSPESRKIVYRLGELALETNDVDEASDCYEEFKKLAPKDPNRFILQYKILRASNDSIQKQINALEAFKKEEYVEKWAYELAKLYDEAGMTAECLEECDDLILWFSEGTYIFRAMELKKKYRPLTPLQQEKYDGYLKEIAHKEESVAVHEAEPEALQEAHDEDNKTEPEVQAKAPEKDIPEVEEKEIFEEVKEVEKVEEADELEVEATQEPEDELKEAKETTVEKVQEENSEEKVSALSNLDLNTKLGQEKDEAMRVTGQMMIDEILQEWEEKQKKNADAIEDQKKIDDEKADAQRAEAQRRREEEARRIEEQQRAAEEARRLAEQRAAEEERRLARERAAEEERLAKEKEEAERRRAIERLEEEERLLDSIAAGRVANEVEEKKEEPVEEVIEEPAEDIFEEPTEEVIEEPAEEIFEEPAEEVIEEPVEDIFEEPTVKAVEEPTEEIAVDKVEESAFEDEVFEEPVEEDDIDFAREPEKINFDQDLDSEFGDIFDDLDAFDKVEEEDDDDLFAFDDGDIDEAGEKEEKFFDESFDSAFADLDEPDFDKETEIVDDLDVDKETDIADDLDARFAIEEPTEEEIQKRIQSGKGGVPFDTGFVVTGRYDLSATSEIGLKAGLTEEQKKLFSYFVPVRGMSEQIVEVLDNDRREKRGGTSKVGNILIVGQKGSGKTVLAVDIVKAIQKQRNLRQGKVAIVTGESLNKKELANIIQKLRGGAIIIEQAGDLNARTVRELDRLMEKKTGELLVLLEDQRQPLEKVFLGNPSFKSKFTSKLELPIFINDELVTFGQTYAKENGYKLDEMGILALYSRIDVLQREDHSVTVAEVKELMDEAIEHSQKANVKHLARRMFGKGTDEKDRIILKEDDFRI